MNFRKGLSALLSSFMAISTIGGVGSVKAMDYDENMSFVLDLCAMSVLGCYLYDLKNNIDNYNEIKERQEDLNQFISAVKSRKRNF